MGKKTDTTSKTYKWLVNTRKDAQYFGHQKNAHLKSQWGKKNKIKSQWDTTTLPPTCLFSLPDVGIGI